MITALGLAIVGITKVDDALYMAERRASKLPKSFQDLTLDINKADDALKSYMDHLNEIKGIPEEIGELEVEKTGAALDSLQAGVTLEELMKRPDATSLDIAQAKYHKDAQERRLIAIIDKIEALKKRPAELGPTMYAETVAARGITTGQFMGVTPGYYGRTEGAPREGIPGGVMDFLFGKQPGGMERIPFGAYDQYGAPTNFLYNRNIPAINITQNVTVASASDVKTVLEDGLSLAEKARAQGY